MNKKHKIIGRKINYLSKVYNHLENKMKSDVFTFLSNKDLISLKEYEERDKE